MTGCLLGYEILSVALGFPVLPVTAEPSGCPFVPPERNFGDECRSGTAAHFPKDVASVSDHPGPKSVVFCGPVTQSLKERFRFSSIF